MEYRALTVGLTDKLFSSIQILLTSSNLHLIPSPTVRDASNLLNRKLFHLLILDLKYLQRMGQVTWISDIRRTNFIPVIVLSTDPERDTRLAVQLGADTCVSDKHSGSVIADLVFAQLRRYTEYNNHRAPEGVENAPFQVGDIFIDPGRRIVEVCGRPVALKPREFSMLLYFMRNPNRVLSSGEICEEAWGMGGSYNRGISQPIRILRLAIEPNPKKPVYIETVRLVGYRFTACNVETCDIC